MRHTRALACVCVCLEFWLCQEWVVCVRACLRASAVWLWHNLQPTTNTLSTSAYFSVAWELAGHFDILETVGARKHSYFHLQFYSFIYSFHSLPRHTGQRKRSRNCVSVCSPYLYFVFCFITIFVHRRHGKIYAHKLFYVKMCARASWSKTQRRRWWRRWTWAQK